MTSVEQNPSAKHSWERESRLGDVSLQVFCNSAVHNRIDNDSENFQAIVKKAGSIDNLSIRDDDPGTIFVRIKIDLADDDLSLVLGKWTKQHSDFIGYGTGNANVGFSLAKGEDMRGIIENLTIKNSPDLSLFIPVSVTKDMLSED